MTDRESFEKWIDLQQHDGYKEYDIWIAATIAERERCEKYYHPFKPTEVNDDN